MAIKRELGTLERSFIVADQHAPFQIVSVVHLEHAPAPNILKQVLKILQNRHAFLRMRLIKEAETYYFENQAEPDLLFHVLPRWNSEHWLPITEAELGNRIDVSTGPLFRCVYLYDATKEQGDVILSFFHAIADAASVGQFVHQLLTTCTLLMSQKTIALYELPPAPPIESRFPPAFRGLGLTWSTFRYALKQMINEFKYRRQTRGQRLPTVHTHPIHGRILSTQVSGDLLEAFMQDAHKQGITLNSALNAAMLLAVNRHLYAGQRVLMRTLSFASLRPYIQPPLRDEELACCLSTLRYAVVVEGNMDFWVLARDLHAKIYSSFKSGDKFAAAIMAEQLMKTVTGLKSFRMGATALAYNGALPVQSYYGGIQVMGLHGFVSVYDAGPEFSAQAQIFNNQLYLDFMYLEADMNREEARQIVEEIKNILSMTRGEEVTRPLPEERPNLLRQNPGDLTGTS